MRSIVLIVHNVRSSHNVGSILRTADGLGINRIYFTGYTPYPKITNDPRLPHLAAKVDAGIKKTALGAENFVRWHHQADIVRLLTKLKAAGFTIVGLEQTDSAIDIAKFQPPAKVVMIVGSEKLGLDKAVLNLTDVQLKIPMAGKKESFNVAVAAAIALYHLRNL